MQQAIRFIISINYFSHCLLPEESPVDTLSAGFGPAHEDDGANLAVRGGDGEASLGSQQDGEGRADLNGESGGGSHLGQVLADGLDHTATPHPQTHRDANLKSHIQLDFPLTQVEAMCICFHSDMC